MIEQPSSSSAPLQDPVTAYAEAVGAGEILAGKLVRLACERHLRDLESGPKRGLKWDLGEARWVIEFFSRWLCLAEGEFAGRPFHLQPWQQFIIGSLFGWMGPDGTRRFRNAYNEIGKGNGKSPMAGGLGIYMMVADREAGAHCYAAATTRDQAGILFQDAVNMVEASPELKAVIQASGKRKVHNLAHLSSGSFFRPVSAEGRSLDGKRVHYAALDEIHEHPNAAVVEKLRAGTKGRRQALVFEITNSGFDRQSVCWQHHEYSRKILEGALDDDAWFAYVCQLDEGDSWQDESVWPKANPNLGISISLKYLREQVREALGMPIKQNIVRRLNFCEWTEQSNRWMDQELWASCAGSYAEGDMLGKDCYGGLDLAKANDFASLVLVFPGSPVRCLPFFWLPEAGLQERAAKHGVSFDKWAEEGLLRTTPGPVIDFDFIRRDINDIAARFNILEMDYDPYQAQQMRTQLEGDGLTMVELRQGFLSLNEPTCELMRLVKSKAFQHNNHPVMNWMVSNIAIAQDAAGNIKIDKAASGAHVDGPAALVDGMAPIVRNSNGPSIYESQGLATL